jgi:hypothetical protein
MCKKDKNDVTARNDALNPLTKQPLSKKYFKDLMICNECYGLISPRNKEQNKWQKKNR